MDLDDQLLHLLDDYITNDNLCEIQKLLIRGADSNTIDRYGNGPLHLAIQKSPGNLKLVLELIKFGADVNVVNNKGYTPLVVSLNNKCHETTEILVKRGSALNFQCQRGWTPLMIASMAGDLRSVRILLLHGANANKCDVLKKTALIYACEGRYLNVVKVLLEYGANPGMCDDFHRTALHYCLEKPRRRLDIINELLLHCASLSNLGINKDEFFLEIMNKYLREIPFNHACVQTLIKIQMLFYYDHHYGSKFGDFYDFALSCHIESRFMLLHKVNSYISVKRLLMICLNGYMPTDSELEGLLPFVANGFFPTYSDILRALIRKSFLRKKFMNMFIYAKRRGQGDIITLNSDVNSDIMSYLSDDDVSSFVLASYIKIRTGKKRNHLGYLHPTELLLNELASR